MTAMQMGGREDPSREPPTCLTRAPSSSIACVAAALAALALSGCGSDPETDARPLDVVATIGSVGIWPGQFATPRALDTDGSTLWVIDKAARIQRLDAQTGAPLSEWKTPRHANGMPVGVTCAVFDGRPLTFVADTHEHRVLVYEPGSDPGSEVRIVAEFGSYGTGPGQFIYVTDVAVVADPSLGVRIYVSEYGGSDRVSVFNERFEFLFSIGEFGTGEDPSRIEFNRPQALVIDEEARELIVVDACNHRIGRFTLEGELIAWIGSPSTAGRKLGQFKYPYSIALLDDGTALVVEYENARIQRIDMRTGRGIRTYGKPGRGPGELVTPWSIAMVGRTAFVLDAGNNRVQAFRAPRPGQPRATEVASLGAMQAPDQKGGR